ncbi:HNH endonuclease [Streptomyces sp. NPDC051555]|uniref:HNH endonuclease n=1 Tax=Streptomyces sp. NPDC051555 TaxID=3365657 RepID=UPI0037AC0C12
MPLFIGGYEDTVWCSKTQFGSGIAKALITYISASGGGAECPLDYPRLAWRLEFTEHELRSAVGHLVGHDFARVVTDHSHYDGNVLQLLTPGRRADDAELAEIKRQKDAQRAAKIALRGGQVNRAAIPDSVRAVVLNRDGHACQACHSNENLTLDHIYPWSLGGPDTVENLQTLCRSCNSRKRDRV